MSDSQVPADIDTVELVQRFQGGDQDAFTRLFDRFHQPVLGYVYHTVHSRAAAEDVVQEAFIRAHERIHQLGPPYDFKSWLYRIASNLAIDHIRKHKREVDVEDDKLVYLEDPPSTRRPYERRLRREEIQDAVWQSLQGLPTHYRQALVLREFNELSYEEVSRTLEVSYDNARQIVHRARTKFRDLHGLRLAVEEAAQRCGELGDLLSAYRDGELDPVQSEEVKDHLATCQDCQQEQEELDKVGALLAGLLPVVPSEAWQAEVLKRVQKKAMAQKGPATAPAPRRNTPDPAGSGGGEGSAGAGAASGGSGPVAAIGGYWPLVLGLPLVAAAFLGGLLFFGGIGGGSGATATPAVLGALATAGETGTAVAAVSAGETGTPSPTLEATASSTPTATRTPPPTVGPPLATVEENSNCRAGPSDQFRVQVTLAVGQTVPIAGRSEHDTYWWVELPEGGGHCYVWKGLTDATGDLASVPYVDDPPTPTPVDEEPPSVGVSHSPQVPGSNDNVTFSAEADDDLGVASLEIWVKAPGDNNAQQAAECGGPSCDYEGGPYPSGSTVDYFAIARDEAGNEAQSATMSFKIK